MIDVHTHFMPHRVMQKMWAYFDRADQLFDREWKIAYRVAEQTRLAQLRDFAV